MPEQTLRDRTKGLVDLDAKIGFDTIFSKDEENKLVGHITYMAEIGYGYNASGIKYMAKDYADSLGKHVKAKETLSNNWFYNFLKRWPNLKVVKPQKLSIARAKSASRDTLNNYYKELGTILTNNGLRDKPQNIDETREPDKLRIFVNYALKRPEYECLSNFSRITYCCHFSAYARGFVLFRIYESLRGRRIPVPGREKPDADANNSLPKSLADV